MKELKQTADPVPADVIETIERNAKWGNGQVRRITLKNLAAYGTSCGTVGEEEKVFANKSVSAFLENNSRGGFVLAATTGLAIFYLAVRWKGSKEAAQKLSHKFSEMVYKNGGSLRADESINNGWDTYESE